MSENTTTEPIVSKEMAQTLAGMYGTDEVRAEASALMVLQVTRSFAEETGVPNVMLLMALGPELLQEAMHASLAAMQDTINESGLNAETLLAMVRQSFGDMRYVPGADYSHPNLIEQLANFTSEEN